MTNLVELSFSNPDEIMRAWFNPDFNPPLDAIDKYAHISVWNDVKLYMLMMVVLALAVELMLITSFVKALRSSFQERLSVIKSKFV